MVHQTVAGKVSGDSEIGRELPGPIAAQSVGGRGHGNRQVTVFLHGVRHQGGSELFEIRRTGDRLAPRPGFVQRRQQHRRQNGDDSDHYKDNLSNILICSILAMTRRKAEGELGNESVDLCTPEQWEG